MRREIRKGRRRARRHLRRHGFAIGRGWTAFFVLLLLAFGLAALLDARRERADIADLMAYARERRTDPAALITSAARTNRLLFLSDIHRSALPKRIAADAIEALAHGPGLDAVVLEVGSDQQPFIDAYLSSDPENIAILYVHPRTLHAQWGVDRAVLEIYRRVWRLNRELGPGREIRIVAADLPGWPPDRRLSPGEAARRFAQRDAHMEQIIEDRILATNPWARVLIFMGGFHGLKGSRATIRFGGGPPVEVTWLVTRLAENHPGEVYSIMLDAGSVPVPDGSIAVYRSTRLFDLFRRNLPDVVGPFALTVNDRFDFLPDPILSTAVPGLNLAVRPEGYHLKDVIDGYIFLGVR